VNEAVFEVDIRPLRESVMDPETPARCRFQQRPVSKQRPDNEFTLNPIEWSLSRSTREVRIHDKLSSLGIAP
jgi:alpha-mannosidase